MRWIPTVSRKGPDQTRLIGQNKVKMYVKWQAGQRLL